MGYPVYCEGKSGGSLCVSRVGEDTCFELTGSRDGIYRVWIEGEQGELSLGIMENGRLYRRFSRYMTHSIGKPVCARLESLSQAIYPWRAVTEYEFCGWQLPMSARCRSAGDFYELALPYNEREAFPMLPLFCFAKIETIDGRKWAIFKFDAAWQPVMGEN